MILLYRMDGGIGSYKEFARIKDGEIIEGEFLAPEDLDLSDEQAVLQRFTGPGVLAAKPKESDASEVYQCTMCGYTHEADREATEPERWMPCSECGKDRFFELTGERE